MTLKVVTRINSCIDHIDNTNENMKTTLKYALNLISLLETKSSNKTMGPQMGSPISGLLAEFILRPLEMDIYKFGLYPPYTDQIYSSYGNI